MDALLYVVLSVSFFGLPGGVVGWLLGRRSAHPYRAAVLCDVAVVITIALVGRRLQMDPFGAWAYFSLIGIALVNGATLIGGAGLARHVAARDAHLYEPSGRA